MEVQWIELNLECQGHQFNTLGLLGQDTYEKQLLQIDASCSLPAPILSLSL